VIDTNALISFVTDRNLAQQQKIADLLDGAVRLKSTILCPQNALTEFVYVLDKVYATPKRQIRSMIKDFLKLPGIKVLNDVDFESVLDFWPDRLPDFGDAIVASVCRSNKGAIAATFDRKLINVLKKLKIAVASF
jgi:predicted nucleic-acid-binding protein